MGKKCFRPPLIYFYYLLTLNQSLLHNSRLDLAESRKGAERVFLGEEGELNISAAMALF